MSDPFIKLSNGDVVRVSEVVAVRVADRDRGYSGMFPPRVIVEYRCGMSTNCIVVNHESYDDACVERDQITAGLSFDPAKDCSP